jgi:hypothetical protein
MAKNTALAEVAMIFGPPFGRVAGYSGGSCLLQK